MFWHFSLDFFVSSWQCYEGSIHINHHSRVLMVLVTYFANIVKIYKNASDLHADPISQVKMSIKPLV